MRILVAAALAAAFATAPAAAEEAAEAEKTLLEITNVVVEPASPGPATLCQLRVEIANRGRETASRFAFEVRVGGQALPAYEDLLVLQPIAPGESAVFRLYDFWSSETGRPFPEDGKLAVEVTLTEASWVRVDGPTGARRPSGEVAGLPVSGTATLRSPSRRDGPE